MSLETLNTDVSKINQVTDLVLAEKEARQYHFPEEGYITILREYERRMSLPGFAANALFLTTMFVRGGKTELYFKSLTDREDELSNFSWLFMPNVVNETDEEIIQANCRAYFKPQGFPINAVSGWKHNCNLLTVKYGGDIRNFFRENGDDANTIIQKIFYKNRAKTWEKIKAGVFLGYGHKLAQLAVQWIHKYNLYEFNEIEKSGFPADLWAMKIAVQTGMISLDGPTNTNLISIKTLIPSVSKTCEDRAINPRDVQEIIWHIGSHRCANDLHQGCPLYEVCNGVLKGNPQDKGKIDPENLKSFKEISRFSQPKLL